MNWKLNQPTELKSTTTFIRIVYRKLCKESPDSSPDRKFSQHYLRSSKTQHSFNEAVTEPFTAFNILNDLFFPVCQNFNTKFRQTPTEIIGPMITNVPTPVNLSLKISSNISYNHRRSGALQASEQKGGKLDLKKNTKK